MRNNKEEQVKTHKPETLRTLRACKIILSDIALDSHIIQLYPKLATILKKKEKQIKQPLLCLNKSKNFSNNVCLLSTEKKITALRDKHRIVKSRNSLRNGIIIANERKIKTTKLKLNDENLETTTDVSSNNLSINCRQVFVSLRQHSWSDMSSELCSRNSDRTFIPSTSTYSSNETQRTEMERNARFNNIKNRLRKRDVSCRSSGSIMANTSSKNSSKETNLASSNYNSEMRDTLKKCSVRVQYNNNSQSESANTTSSTTTTISTLIKEQHKKDNGTSSNVICTEVENQGFVNITNNNIIRVLPNPSESRNRDKNTNKAKKFVLKRSLPKIIADNIVPKGMINIRRLDKKDQNNMLLNTSSKLICLKQNRYNDNEKYMKKTGSGDVIKSTNVLKEGKCTSCNINEPDSLKTSESVLKLNNNINLKDKNILNDRLQNNVALDHDDSDCFTRLRNNMVYNKTTSSKETIINESHSILQAQLRLNKLDINNKMPENDKTQDSENDETQDSDDKTNNEHLSKSTLDLADIHERCNMNEFDKKIVNKNGKRITENKIKNLNLENKRIKLNVNSWLENQAFLKSKDDEQSNDFSDSTTISLSTKSNNAQSSHKKEVDLREHLNRKRFNKSYVSTSDVIKDAAIMAKNQQICKKLSIEERPIVSETFCEKKENARMNMINNNNVYSQDTLRETQHTNQIDTNIRQDTDMSKSHVIIDNEDGTSNSEDDSDCISLFANESFDESNCENIFLDNANEPRKFLQSEAPYEMSATTFDKYMKQNANEFDKEFAKCEGSSATKLNKAKKQVLNQLTLPIDVNAQSQSTLFTTTMEMSFNETGLISVIKGYCFGILKNSVCSRSSTCIFKHNLQDLVNSVYSQEPDVIFMIIRDALLWNFITFCEKIYVASLSKLSVEQILMIYKMIHAKHLESSLIRSKIESRKFIIHSIIRELLKRQMLLKVIVEHLVTCIAPSKNVEEFENILTSVEVYVKPGEYWSTMKSSILKFQPTKYVVHTILSECISTKNFANIEEVNDILMNKLDPMLRLTLNGKLVENFKTLIAEKTASDSNPVITIQNFGECIRVDSIASPDSKQNTSLSQTESLRKQYVSFINQVNTNGNERELTREEVDVVTSDNVHYTIQPIDNLPDARSIYREQTNLWKFYVDLDRFKKGLEHKDYDYVIDILKSYMEKSGENSLFVRSCCNILRAEVKCSEYHLKQIIQRTVQTGTSDILGKIFFVLGLNILNDLLDKEAAGLALSLIQSLKIYGLPFNAEFLLLSAEIYLANDKTLEALDLLKYKNIICTSRAKWHVESTVHDEDQSSQYHPIDLSRYIDKLIVLSLSSKDTNLITEMGNLILKYNFALSATPCRALISTLIHMDEILARQIYNYAEGIGIYSTVKLWPVLHIILNTDLTEEEIYLAFLQLLKILKLNLGQGIKHAKPQDIKVYLFLEVKSKNEQFYREELHYNSERYNNQSITNTKTLIKNVLRQRFDPPISLMQKCCKGRICRVQSTSLINYLISEHYN